MRDRETMLQRLHFLFIKKKAPCLFHFAAEWVIN